MKNKNVFYALACSISLFTMSCSSNQYLITNTFSNFEKQNTENTKTNFVNVKVKIPISNLNNNFSLKDSETINYFSQSEIKEVELQIKNFKNNQFLSPIIYFKSYSSNNPIEFDVSVPLGMNLFTIYAKTQNGTIIGSLSCIANIEEFKTITIDVITTLETQVQKAYQSLTGTLIIDIDKLREFIIAKTEYDTDTGIFTGIDPYKFNPYALAEAIKNNNGIVPANTTEILNLEAVGNLKVITNLSGYNVWISDINNNYVNSFVAGNTNIFNNITCGKWNITIAKEGYQVKNVEFEIKKDQTTELNLELEEELFGYIFGNGNDSIVSGSGNYNVNIYSNNGILRVNFNNSQYISISESNLQKLFLQLGTGNDTINIQNNVNIPININAGEGNNYIISNSNNKVEYYGGSANDFISGNTNYSNINTGNGSNQITLIEPIEKDFVNDFVITISGGIGSDTLNYYGNSSLYASLNAGNDYLNIPNFNNNISKKFNNSSNFSSITLSGGAGNDKFNISSTFASKESLETIVSNIKIFGDYGNDTLNYSANLPINVAFSNGNDSITGCYPSGSYINLGDGNNFANISNNQNFTSNNNASTLLGGLADDSFTFLGNGNNYISVATGNNFVKAGDGNDYIYTCCGKDTVFAGNGDDFIDGGDESDYLNGEGGNDTLIGNSNYDTLIGGLGNNTIIDFANLSSPVNIINGQLTIIGTSQDDIISIDSQQSSILINSQNYQIDFTNVTSVSLMSDAGDDFIDVNVNTNVPVTIIGGLGNDYIDGTNINGSFAVSGSDGNDSILGGIGGNFIFGDIGNDSLIAGSGSSTLDGGLGLDTLTTISHDKILQGVDTVIGNTTFRGLEGNDFILYN